MDPLEKDIPLVDLNIHNKNDMYYFEIKELIHKRKIELDKKLKGDINVNINTSHHNINSGCNYVKGREEDNSKNKSTLSGVIKNNILENTDNLTYINKSNNSKPEHINNYNYYINKNIMYTYIKYKYMYDFYVQNKNILKKEMNKEEFNEFVKKYFLLYKKNNKTNQHFNNTSNDILKHYNQSIPCVNRRNEHSINLNEDKNINQKETNDEDTKNDDINMNVEDYHDITLGDSHQNFIYNIEEENIKQDLPEETCKKEDNINDYFNEKKNKYQDNIKCTSLKETGKDVHKIQENIMNKKKRKQK